MAVALTNSPLTPKPDVGSLPVKLRGRVQAPDWSRGRILSPGARGANQTTHHGLLQRLLGAGWRSRHQAIATHNGNKSAFIRCSTSLEDITNIAEKLGSNVGGQEN